LRKSALKKETAKAFLLAQAPSLFATRAANVLIVLLEAGVLLAANLREDFFSNKRTTELSNGTLPLIKFV